jgi:ketosteroid isomerase-like protein
MSEENVELARRIFEALNRNDIDAAIEKLDPEVEWVPPASLPERRTFRGRDWAGMHLIELLEPFDDSRFELEDVIDAGDRTLVAVHVVGRGKTSGFEMDARFYSVLTWRSGRAIRVENIFDHAQALEAAGLRE